ncbi:MAG: tetratricopeptide repeat protein [Desulfomonilaceae bacterium]
MSKRHWLFLLVVLPLFILGALALHYSAFKTPMYYDSVGFLELNDHIFASKNVFKVIQIFPQRPVSMLTFYLNYSIWGMNPFYFRLVNSVMLAMTAFIAALAYILILEIAGPPAPGRSTEKQVIGLFLGIVFLVHPIQTYFVDYIWQRIALLSCFFYVSALTAYLATRSGRIRHTAAGYVLCLVLFCLALASKENAVTLPAVLILAEIAFFWAGWKSLLKRATVFAVILLVLVGILSFLERAHGSAVESPGIFATVAEYYRESGLTLPQVVVSQCRVLFSYLGLILVPIPSNVRFAVPQVIFSSPLESPSIMAAVLGALAILAIGIVLIRKRPLIGFGLLFFLVNLAPESLLLPKFLFLTYRASLPMFGLLLVLADGLLEILARTRSVREQPWYLRPAPTALLAAVVVAVMSLTTVSKANLWRDPVLFWSDVVEGFPIYDENVEKQIGLHALDSLGVALHKQGKNVEAVETFRRVLEISPLYMPSYVNLAAAYAALGDTAEAEASVKKAVEIEPQAPRAQFALGEFYLKQDRLSEALFYMQKAADLAPSDPRCLTGLGTVLLSQGSASEAASVFLRAIDLTPGFDEAHYNLGEAYVSLGMDQEAAVQFNSALELKRENWQAHNSLGLLLAKSGDLKGAAAHFRQALLVSPRNWRIHNNLGVLLAKSGNYAEAAAHFENAARHNPKDDSARKNLERVRALMGKQSAK